MKPLPRHHSLADYDPFVDSVGPVHESEAFLVQRVQDGITAEAFFRKSLRRGASVALTSALNRELRLAYLNWGIRGRAFIPPQHVVEYLRVKVDYKSTAADAAVVVETEDAGPSLDRWLEYRLLPLPPANAAPTHLLTPRRLVALLHTLLLALRDELHSVKLLHCDLYDRNICIPFDRHPEQPHALRLRIDRLRLIDLGTAVQPHVNGDASDRLELNPDPGFDEQGRDRGERFAPSLRQALRDDRHLPYATHVLKLDHRVDLYALGYMAIGLYNGIADTDWRAEPATDRSDWGERLRSLCTELKALDCDGQPPPAGLHDHFIGRLAELTEALGPAAPQWYVPLPRDGLGQTGHAGRPAGGAAPTPLLGGAANTPVLSLPAVAGDTPVMDPLHWVDPPKPVVAPAQAPWRPRAVAAVAVLCGAAGAGWWVQHSGDGVINGTAAASAPASGLPAKSVPAQASPASLPPAQVPARSAVAASGGPAPASGVAVAAVAKTPALTPAPATTTASAARPSETLNALLAQASAGQWSPLEATLARHQRLFPGQGPSEAMLSQLQAAQAQVDAAQYALAAKSLGRLTRLFPGYGDAWAARGYAELRLGQSDNAQASLKQALELQAADAGAWAHLAEALAAQNRLPAADAALQLAVYLAADRSRVLRHVQGADRERQHPAFQTLVQRRWGQLNQLPARRPPQ